MSISQFSFWSETADPKKNLRLLRIIVWTIAISLGLLETLSARFWLSHDATDYLDIASAYLRLDFHQAVNAYWSPLFSWLLAAALAAFRPSPQSEAVLLHAVNFVGFLALLRSFEYFFCLLLQARDEFRPASAEDAAFPCLAFWALGYGIFLSTSFLILSLSSSTPDVWVCLFTYLVAGLLLSIHLRGASWLRFLALGLTLALAYLTKTFYFPLSFVFLLAAWGAAGFSKKSLKFAAAGLLFFSLLAGSWVILLSRSEGHFTFGDVGKIAMGMYLGRVPQAHLWQGQNSTGIPLHPVRQLLSQPHLYEFSSPWGGTYPPTLHWAYWARGLHPRFHAFAFLSILRQSVGTFFLLLMPQAEFAVALLFLFFLVRSASDHLSVFRALSWLWAPPLIACLAYAVVLVEGRYVAPFLPILWIVAFFGLSAAARLPSRVFLALLLAVISFTGLRLAKLAVSDLAAISSGSRNGDAEIALALRNLGLRPGDRIASLGSPTEPHWARQAGLSIVAEIPRGDETVFWRATPDKKQEVFRLIAGTGAKFVVASETSPTAAQEGWIPLSDSGYYAYRLP